MAKNICTEPKRPPSYLADRGAALGDTQDNHQVKLGRNDRKQMLDWAMASGLWVSPSSTTEDWFYGSLWRRVYGDDDSRAILSPWPIPMPRTWIAKVNRPQSQAKEEAIRKSLKKGSPYGSKRFVAQASVRLKLEHTLRSRGRPKKA